MAGISTGNRAVKGRAGRKLPTLELPSTDNPSLSRAFQSIAEHFRVYEGDGTAPKERFVTLRELEDSGLISVGTKAGYGYISQILNKDVAQKSGSTANPTLKGSPKRDTALGPRTPGGGGAGSSNPIEAGKRSRVNKLSDIENVKVASPAQADFLYYDGGKWKNYSLFKRENRWLKQQNFAADVVFAADVDVTGNVEAGTLSIGGVDIDTYLDDYVEIGTLTQNDDFVLLNRTDASNPPLYVVQAGAGSVLRAGVGTVGSTTFTGAKLEMLNSGQLLIDAAAGEMLTLKDLDNAAGNTYNAWIQFDDNLDARQGFIGFGSSGNQDLYIWNDAAGDIRFDSDLYIGDGANTLTIETSSGDAAIYLKADTDNDTETDNPFIRMEQDANAVALVVGLTGTADEAADGSTMTGATGNFVTYLTTYVSGGHQWGTGTTMHMKSDTTQTTITGDTAGTHALLVTNAGSTNSIAKFLGDSDGLEINTISGGDYAIRNTAQDNSIIFYDGTGGVDIRYNGGIRIECDSGNDVALYYNGVEEFHTQDSNAAGNTTGAQVKLHAGQAFYDVGLNVMPRMHTNTSFTLTDDDCGGYMYHSNSTTYTITLNNSSGGGADFPIGGTFFILNYGSGNVTVNTGSGTLYCPQLATSTTGSFTVGGNSVATILKYGADVWFIWGDDIS
jgi:hypothetical protein